MSEPMKLSGVPTALKSWVEENARVDAIDSHGFDLNLSLWNRQMGHLSGGPVI